MTMPNCIPNSSTIIRSLVPAALVLILSFAPVWSQTIAPAQVFEWARQGSGFGWKQGNAIAVDVAKNAIMVGEFSGNKGNTAPNIFAIEFPSPLPAPNAQLSAWGNTDAFMVMYDAQGNRQWVVQIGKAAGSATPSSIVATSIAVTQIAGVRYLYVTGEIYGTIEFNGLTQQPGTVEAGSSFIALYKYDNAGATAQWVNIMGPLLASTTPLKTLRSTGLGVDVNGNAFVCGTLRGAVTFTSITTPALTAQSAPGASSLFVARYSILGSLQWVKTGGGSAGSSYGSAIAVNPAGDAVITGYYTGTVLFPGASPGSLSGSTTNRNLLVARCSSTGAFNWVGGSIPASPQPGDSSMGQGVAVDPGGNIYVVGAFGGSLSLGSGPAISSTARDLFIMKINGSTGAAAWLKQGNVGLTGDAIGNGVVVQGTNVSITGTFSGRLKLGTGVGRKMTLGSLGNHDAFIAQFDPTGELGWARRTGNGYSGLTPGTHYDQGKAIAVDNVGALYVAGEFGGDVEFLNIPRLSHPHVRNVFVAKLSDTAVRVEGHITWNGINLLPNQLVEIVDPSGNYKEYATSDDEGRYIVFLPRSPSGSYTIKLVPDLLVYWKSTPTTGYVVGNTGSQGGKDFNLVTDTPADPLGIPDLQVSIKILSTENAISGQEVRYLITYRNIGSANTSPADIFLCYDNHFDTPRPLFATANYLPLTTCQFASNAGGSLAFHVTQLAPFDGGSIVVGFKLATGLVDGTPVQSVVGTNHPTPTAGSRLASNTISADQTVVRPSDPNAKSVVPAGNVGVAPVRAGDILTYTIQFYNVGPGVAEDVEVSDEFHVGIDAFDLNDITILSAGPVMPTVQPAHGTLISPVLRFENANLLPYDQSIPGSRGFVTFSVKIKRPVANNPIGSKVTNDASIQFFGSGGQAEDVFTTNLTSNCLAPDFTVANVCLGDNTQFATSTGNTSYLPALLLSNTLVWSFGDGQTATGPDPNHRYALPGAYLVTLSFSLDARSSQVSICSQRDSNRSFTISKVVEISPAPQAAITMGAGGQLTSAPAASYQWYYEGNAIAGATKQSHQATQNGTYIVRVKNEGGCEVSSDPAVVGDLGVELAEREVDRAIAIMPNPGSGRFVIDLRRSPSRSWNVSVVDARGVEVMQRAIESGRSMCELDLEGQPAGSYTASITVDGRVVMRRFVLQR